MHGQQNSETAAPKTFGRARRGRSPVKAPKTPSSKSSTPTAGRRLNEASYLSSSHLIRKHDCLTPEEKLPPTRSSSLSPRPQTRRHPKDMPNPHQCPIRAQSSGPSAKTSRKEIKKKLKSPKISRGSNSSQEYAPPSIPKAQSPTSSDYPVFNKPKASPQLALDDDDIHDFGVPKMKGGAKPRLQSPTSTDYPVFNKPKFSVPLESVDDDIHDFGMPKMKGGAKPRLDEHDLAPKDVAKPVPTARRKSIKSSDKSGSSNSSVTEHEYLQFSLRITEDIIRNDLYTNKEMRRVFNSHIEANRGRLNLAKMMKQIEDLCVELNIPFNEEEDIDSATRYEIKIKRQTMKSSLNCICGPIVRPIDSEPKDCECGSVRCLPFQCVQHTPEKNSLVEEHDETVVADHDYATETMFKNDLDDNDNDDSDETCLHQLRTSVGSVKLQNAPSLDKLTERTEPTTSYESLDATYTSTIHYDSQSAHSLTDVEAPPLPDESDNSNKKIHCSPKAPSGPKSVISMCCGKKAQVNSVSVQTSMVFVQKSGNQSVEELMAAKSLSSAETTPTTSSRRISFSPDERKQLSPTRSEPVSIKARSVPVPTPRSSSFIKAKQNVSVQVMTGPEVVKSVITYSKSSKMVCSSLSEPLQRPSVKIKGLGDEEQEFVLLTGPIYVPRESLNFQNSATQQTSLKDSMSNPPSELVTCHESCGSGRLVATSSHQKPVRDRCGSPTYSQLHDHAAASVQLPSKVGVNHEANVTPFEISESMFKAPPRACKFTCKFADKLSNPSRSEHSNYSSTIDETLLLKSDYDLTPERECDTAMKTKYCDLLHDAVTGTSGSTVYPALSATQSQRLFTTDSSQQTNLDAYYKPEETMRFGNNLLLGDDYQTKVGSLTHVMDFYECGLPVSLSQFYPTTSTQTESNDFLAESPKEGRVVAEEEERNVVDEEEKDVEEEERNVLEEEEKDVEEEERNVLEEEEKVVAEEENSDEEEQERAIGAKASSTVVFESDVPSELSSFFVPEAVVSKESIFEDKSKSIAVDIENDIFNRLSKEGVFEETPVPPTPPPIIRTLVPAEVESPPETPASYRRRPSLKPPPVTLPTLLPKTFSPPAAPLAIEPSSIQRKGFDSAIWNELNREHSLTLTASMETNINKVTANVENFRKIDGARDVKLNSLEDAAVVVVEEELHVSEPIIEVEAIPAIPGNDADTKSEAALSIGHERSASQVMAEISERELLFKRPDVELEDVEEDTTCCGLKKKRKQRRDTIIENDADISAVISSVPEEQLYGDLASGNTPDDRPKSIRFNNADDERDSIGSKVSYANPDAFENPFRGKMGSNSSVTNMEIAPDPLHDALRRRSTLDDEHFSKIADDLSYTSSILADSKVNSGPKVTDGT